MRPHFLCPLRETLDERHRPGSMTFSCRAPSPNRSPPGLADAAVDAASFWKRSGRHESAGQQHLRSVEIASDLDEAFRQNRTRGVSPPDWKYLPTAAQAAARRREDIALLRRARRPRKEPLTVEEWSERQTHHHQLASDLQQCRPARRCRSLSCRQCRRSLAQWSASRREALFSSSAIDPSWRSYQLTIVPVGLQFREGTLDRCDPIVLNSRLLEVLDSVRDLWIAAGELEVSYEEVVGSNSYWQPHWHLLASGPDVSAIAEQLREILPTVNPNNPSVVARQVYNLHGAAQYGAKPAEKGYRWVAAAPGRARRRVIPDTRRRELLLWLHRWSPWGMQVFVHCELMTSAGGVQIRSTLDRGE